MAVHWRRAVLTPLYAWAMWVGVYLYIEGGDYPVPSYRAALLKVLPIGTLVLAVLAATPRYEAKGGATPRYGGNQGATPKYGASRHRTCVALGLAFSALGDVLLVWIDSMLTYGGMAFGVAHLFYIIGLWARDEEESEGQGVKGGVTKAGARTRKAQSKGIKNIAVVLPRRWGVLALFGAGCAVLCYYIIPYAPEPLNDRVGTALYLVFVCALAGVATERAVALIISYFTSSPISSTASVSSPTSTSSSSSASVSSSSSAILIPKTSPSWFPEILAAMFGALGAIVFVASDTILLLDRFSAPYPILPERPNLWVMLTYYAAQLGIAFSVVLRHLEFVDDPTTGVAGRRRAKRARYTSK